MPMFFSSSGNVLLKQILHSGQWKWIFRLLKFILFQYLKYPFHWNQFFHLLQIYFKQMLKQSQRQRIFCLVETIFFHSDFFGNHYCNQRDANTYKKKSYFSWMKSFSSFFFFFEIVTQMEVAFLSNEIAFFKEFLVLASGSGHFLLEIRCKSIFFELFNS